MTDTPEHEAKCQRCGISCHGAVPLPDGRQVVVEGLHCIHLGDDNLCTVYENRFEVAPWCHHVSRAGPSDMLRHDCPYTPGGNPKGKVRLAPEEYARVLPSIAWNLLNRASVPLHFSYGAFFDRMRVLDPEHAWSLKTNAVGTSGKLLRARKSFLSRMFS